MIDPVSALAIANTAFSAIKQAVATGREIQDIGSALGEWAGAFSDLSFAEQKMKDPPFYKAIIGSDEQQAIQIFTAKKKLEEQRKEIFTMIGFAYGQRGQEEYTKTLREVRERRRKLQYRRQEMKEKIIEILLAIFILSGGLLIVIIAFWYFGKKQGKW